MTRRLKWLSALLALALIITALPLAAFAQGGPGQGNPPPGQAGNNGNNGNGNDGNGGNGAIVQQLGQIAGQGATQADQARLLNVPAGRLIGLALVDRSGEQIGRVSDLLVSIAGQRQSGDPGRPASGGLVAGARVDYALAQYGGLLGIGGEFVPVPLSALRLHLVDAGRLGFDDNLVYFDGIEPGDDALEARKEFFNGNAFVLVSDQEELDNAPKFDLEGLADVTDHTWDRNLRAYWQGLGPVWPEAPTQNGAAYRVSSARSLSRYDLRELGGDALGNIDDVLITLAVGNPAAAPLPPPVVDNGNDDAGDDGVKNGADNNDADDEETQAQGRALAAALPVLDARIGYALVSHSGFYGIGGSRSPVPFSMLMMDRDYDERTMYAEVNGDLLEDAPALDGDSGGDLNEPNFFNRIHAYWQQAGFGPF